MLCKGESWWGGRYVYLFHSLPVLKKKKRCLDAYLSLCVCACACVYVEKSYANSCSSSRAANFKVDRTSTGDPYVLDYPSCISLLGQASTANGTDHGPYGKGCSYGDGWSFGGWGNTDFGTVFAEAICPSGISCLPWNQRPLGC